MDDSRAHHSVSSAPPPWRKSRSLNLQKCVFCRERKVKVSGVLVSLPEQRVVESRARSVSPRVGSGPTNASIAKGEEKNAAHLGLLQDDTEH